MKANDFVHPLPFDCRLAFQFQTEFTEECNGSLEIVDYDSDIVQSFDY
jgi:hypothetical protein